MTIDGTSTICTCDCLDCTSRDRHVLHDGPPPPVYTERDPEIVTEAELRLLDGNR